MFTIKQGKTWVQRIGWTDENDDPVPLAGCVFRAQLRTDYADTEVAADTDPLLDLTMAAGITIDGDDIVLRAEAAATEALPPGEYLFEVEVTLADGDEDQLVLGALVVEPEVVR